jgi:hypothetical protein
MPMPFGPFVIAGLFAMFQGEALEAFLPHLFHATFGQ